MNETRPLILIIEDEPQIRHFLHATLVNQDYWLCEAATIQEGVIQATMRQPDIVLLDLDLPDHDRLDVTRRLRGALEAPIIVFSAHNQEHDKVAALDAGADDYLTKPFGVDELVMVGILNLYTIFMPTWEILRFTKGEMVYHAVRWPSDAAGCDRGCASCPCGNSFFSLRNAVPLIRRRRA